MPAHVLVQKPKKLERCSRICLFVGYPKETKGGLFYDPQDNKVIVSNNATFLEEDHMKNHQTRSKLILKEISKETTKKQRKVNSEVGPSKPSQDINMPRRSGRVIIQPDRYMGFIETQFIIHVDEVEDQLSYRQAMGDKDKDQWVKVMNLEIESIYFNSVWELVDQPSDVQPIGCKWIYKRKRDQTGKVQTFKARLVAKGHNQREGIDFDQTFSTVAMLKSIRILLSIAAFYNYEIWQMDVKTTFLNEDLDESIYMVQPKGFII